MSEQDKAQKVLNVLVRGVKSMFEPMPPKSMVAVRQPSSSSKMPATWGPQAMKFMQGLISSTSAPPGK